MIADQAIDQAEAEISSSRSPQSSGMEDATEVPTRSPAVSRRSEDQVSMASAVSRPSSHKSAPRSSFSGSIAGLSSHPADDIESQEEAASEEDLDYVIPTKRQTLRPMTVRAVRRRTRNRRKTEVAKRSASRGKRSRKPVRRQARTAPTRRAPVRSRR